MYKIKNLEHSWDRRNNVHSKIEQRKTSSFSWTQIENLGKVIIKLFLNEGPIGTPLKIGGKNVKLKNNLWDEKTSNTQPLKNGKSTFFSDSNEPLYAVNKKSIKDKEQGNKLIKCKKGEEINSYNYD